MDKKNVSIFLTFQILLLLVYVFCATENIVYQDQLDPIVINTIEKFYTGNLKVSDMWGLYNSNINIFGSQLLLILNLIFFKINTRMDMVLGLVSIFLSSFFLISYINKLFNKSSKKVLITVINMVIIFIETSLVQWENIVFGGGSMQLIGICLFLILMYFFEKIIFNKFSFINLFKYFVFVLLSLVFGGQYTLGLFITFFIVYFIEFLVLRDKRKKIIKKSPVLLVLVLCFYLFYSSMFVYDGVFVTSTLSFLEQMTTWFKFVLLTYCGSILGVDVFRNLKIGLGCGYFVGLIIFCVYTYTTILFFRKKIFKQTLIPLLLIIYANITVAIITIGRSDFGESYALTSRYTTSTILGLVGSVIILSFVFFEKKQKFLKTLNALIISFFIFCLSLTNLIEWKNAPFRKIYYQKLEIMALNPKSYNEDELFMFQAKSLNCIYDGFDVLKKYKLNVFE